jgi:hypothetical protein
MHKSAYPQMLGDRQFNYFTRATPSESKSPHFSVASLHLTTTTIKLNGVCTSNSTASTALVVITPEVRLRSTHTSVNVRPLSSCAVAKTEAT